jgi:hypothetical protein
LGFIFLSFSEHDTRQNPNNERVQGRTVKQLDVGGQVSLLEFGKLVRTIGTQLRRGRAGSCSLRPLLLILRFDIVCLGSSLHCIGRLLSSVLFVVVVVVFVVIAETMRSE